MIGVGIASAAITFLNALPTGVGAAAGVGLWATATVDLAAGSSETIEVHEENDSPLVVATASTALARWAPGLAFRARIRVRSDVPIGRGLKSSSAVGTAVARAVASAIGRTPPSEEIAALAADVAQRIGLSATGAFDDALASVEPGLHVTENSTRARIRTDPIDPSWQVLLWLPRTPPHRPSPEYLARFRRETTAAHAAEEAARRGDALDAMARNTEVVERVLGYDYAAVRRAAAAAGALGSGVSGLGPALSFVVPGTALDRVRATLPTSGGDIVATRFTERPDARGNSG